MPRYFCSNCGYSGDEADPENLIIDGEVVEGEYSDEYTVCPECGLGAPIFDECDSYCDRTG